MTKDSSVFTLDSTELIRSLFALIPIPIAVSDHGGRIILANSSFGDVFPGIADTSTMQRHENETPGGGTYDIHSLPLSDSGLKIVYATDVANEVKLRREVVHLEKIAAAGPSVTGGKVTPRRTPFDLNDVVRFVAQSRGYQQKSNRLCVEVDLDPSLPGTVGDPAQIEQVVFSLCLNAEEAVARLQHRPGRIEIRTSVRDGVIQLHVVDNGLSRDVARVAHARQGNLGLSICAEIVKAHNGELYAWSTYGNGSTFIVELPASAHH